MQGDIILRFTFGFHWSSGTNVSLSIDLFVEYLKPALLYLKPALLLNCSRSIVIHQVVRALLFILDSSLNFVELMLWTWVSLLKCSWSLVNRSSCSRFVVSSWLFFEFRWFHALNVSEFVKMLEVSLKLLKLFVFCVSPWLFFEFIEFMIWTWVNLLKWSRSLVNSSSCSCFVVSPWLFFWISLNSCFKREWIH